MKLEYNPSKISNFESFYAERKDLPYYGGHWHYHEEFEILLNLKGEGLRIVGDNMDHFEGETLVIIGSGLPHLFKNDKNGSNAEDVDYIVIKFLSSLNGLPIFSLPEFSKIEQLLKNASRGIIFRKKTIKKVRGLLKNISQSQGPIKIIDLIRVLNILSEDKKISYLSSEGFSLKTLEKGEDRTQKVIDYISENYTKDISLDDLAEVANMTTNSFCRYFKNRTGKTAFQFIREFRINKACQMLINGEKNISQICFDTGFNSFSSFNRIFKSLKNISASEYKSKYLFLN